MAERRGAAPDRPAWRPRFAPFVLVYAVCVTLTWTAWARDPVSGTLGWYASVAWSLPILTALPGMVGAVVTWRRTGPERPPRPAPGPVPELLVVVVPTIGRPDTMPALERVVRSCQEHLPARFPQLRVDLVVEEGCAARSEVTALAATCPLTRIVTVPRAYRTVNGTRFKARANHYAHELRRDQGEARDDVWVLHLDDDTAVGADTAESVAGFVAAQRAAGPAARHLAQGVLTYPREHAVNRLVWLADAIRPGCDISSFAASTGSGSPHAGLHGELLLVRASVEASIGWDFGPRTLVEDAQFAMLFCDRYPGGSDWFAGRSYGASPATVRDFLRQRERWVWGLLELATRSDVPLRQRLLLIRNVAVWICGPLQHPAVVLAAGALAGDLDTTPGTPLVVPLWGFAMGYCAWLYWEGLRLNALSSLRARRAWWEPLCLTALIPVFTLWEVVGVLRGALRFARNGEYSFTVIAKPA